MIMGYRSLKHISIGHCGYKILHVHAISEIPFKTFEEAVVSPLVTGKTRHFIFPRFIEEVERHFGMEYPELVEVVLQFHRIPVPAVQGGALLRAHGRHKIIDHAEIGYEIAF